MSVPDNEWVRLSDLWPRMGFSQMSGQVEQALKTVIRRHRPQVEVMETRQIMTPYAEQLTRWGVDLEKLHGDHDSLKWFITMLPPAPAYHRLSLADIRVRVGGWDEAKIEPKKEVIWRWPYYQFTYTVIWALIFHEPNVILANPRFLMREIFHMWESIHSDVKELYDEEERKKRISWLALALLERVYGIRYDIANNLSHYRENITERIELTPEECEKRAQLFQTAIDTLEKACFMLLEKQCSSK